MRRTLCAASLAALAIACGSGADSGDLGARAEGLSLVNKLSSPQSEQSTFGWAVALSGTRLVVGDPFFGNSPNAHRGATWVFELGSGGWAYTQSLAPLDGPASNNSLGRAVAVSGDVVAVTEPGDMEAHVFAFSAGAWAQQAGIAITPSQDYSIAASGDTVAIGKANEWTGAAYSGAVRVHRQSGTTWPQEQQLAPSDANASSFGYAVALDGNTLVVGAPAGGAVAGMAFVYVRNGSTWSEQGKLQPNPPELGLYGSAVALQGDTAVVGQYNPGSNGSAWVYVRSGTTWSLQTKLTSPAATNAYFAKALGVSGDRLIVGAPLASGAAGAAYLYQRSGTSWSAATPISAADGAANDWFGAAVAVDGARAAVGAPYHGTLGASGAVYTYDLTPTGSGGSGGGGGSGGSTGGQAGTSSGGVSGGGTSSGGTSSGGVSGGGTSSGGTSSGGTSSGGTSSGGTSSGGTSSGGTSSGGTSSGGTSSGGTSSGGISSGGTSSGGSSASGASSSDDGGCGCRTTRGPAPFGSLAWLGVVLVALRRRR